MGGQGSKPMKLKKIGGGMVAMPMVQGEAAQETTEVTTTSPSLKKVKGQEKVVTFVQSKDVITSLRKTCETLNKYEKADKKTGTKKEKYQMYNSGEIVGFNLKMK